jgi:Family of unknown function (DUF6152)
MRIQLSIALAIGLIATSVPVRAHHSFEAEFDLARPVHLVGKVTSMEWINPHSWIHVDVADANGNVQNWMIECGSPNIMLRRGFTKRSLEVGTEITVQGYQAKNGTLRANGSSITFKDGKKLFVGGSNPDVPDDQKK